MELSFDKGNISLRVIYDTRQTKKNGKHAIRFRVIHERNVYYITPGYDLTPGEWEVINKTRQKELRKTKGQIELSFDTIKKHIDDLISKGEYSHTKLNILLKGGKVTNLIQFIDSRILEFEQSNRFGNASVYRSANTFFSKYLGDSITFKTINPKILEQLSEKARADGMRQTSIALYLRTLRAIYNEAILRGSISQNVYPFTRSEGKDGKYHIQEGGGTHIALDAEQMGKIATMQLTDGTPALKRSRDLFLLMFLLGGINIGDLLSIKWRDIIINGDSRELVYVRKKTKRTTNKEVIIKVTVTSTVEKYFNMYGTPDRLPDDLIFPYLNGLTDDKKIQAKIKAFTKNMNDDLKTIAKSLGLPPISTMVSRHSWATISKNSGTNESFIKETLGHATLSTTQKYLKNFEQSKRKANFEQMEGIVNNQ